MNLNYKVFASTITFMIMLIVCLGVSSCGGGDDSPSDNPPVTNPEDPVADVPDPEGTISLAMRTSNNGDTYLNGFLHVKDDNFQTLSAASPYGGGFTTSIVPLGAMKGLGNINRIPTTGWTDVVSVNVGEGYVAYHSGSNEFYRIYVTGVITNINNEIIGYNIKYQKPFGGRDEALSLPITTLDFTTFDQDGTSSYSDFYNQKYGEQTISLKNSTIIPFTAKSSADWCKPSVYMNKLSIKVGQPEAGVKETATVTLTTLSGKTTTIAVSRFLNGYVKAEGGNDVITFKKDEISTSINLESNISELTESSAKTDVDWIKVRSLYEFNEYKGNYYYRMELNISANTGSARTGHINFKDKKGDTVATLTIKQEGITIYTVSDIIYNEDLIGGYHYIKGYIVGYCRNLNPSYIVLGTSGVSSSSNLVVAATADETNTANCLIVRLGDTALTDAFSLYNNKEYLGKQILVNGRVYSSSYRPYLFAYYAVVNGIEVGTPQ